ncbi:MAG: DUF6460 domain-containing protein [Pseudomonadota bacterium]
MSKNLISTLVKLGVASLIVGTILGVTKINPLDFWEGVIISAREMFRSLFGIGWDGVKTVVSYTALGAVVVIPIWLIAKLTKRYRPKKDDPKNNRP